jgi:hypothetical protein
LYLGFCLGADLFQNSSSSVVPRVSTKKNPKPHLVYFTSLSSKERPLVLPKRLSAPPEITPSPCDLLSCKITSTVRATAVTIVTIPRKI